MKRGNLSPRRGELVPRALHGRVAMQRGLIESGEGKRGGGKVSC